MNRAIERPGGLRPLHIRILALLCLGATFWMFQLARPEAGPPPNPEVCTEYPRGFRGATLAMEFVQNPAQVDCIVALGRRRLGPELRADAVTVALYWSILVCLSLLAMRSGRPGLRRLGLIGGICATLGAVADLIENHGIGRLLAGAREQNVIDLVRHAAYWKWGLLAAAFLLLAIFLFRRSAWAWFSGALLLLAGGLTTYCLLAWLPGLSWSVLCIMAGLLLCVLLLLLHPGSLLKKNP
ncbi:MAG TPA: hypothetical protein VJ885_11550 [Thermoanaerobaculia bacterium]|nr:hypothetical protein [Thermoanaerobaculia bacterium]